MRLAGWAIAFFLPSCSVTTVNYNCAQKKALHVITWRAELTKVTVYLNPYYRILVVTPQPILRSDRSHRRLLCLPVHRKMMKNHSVRRILNGQL